MIRTPFILLASAEHPDFKKNFLALKPMRLDVTSNLIFEILLPTVIVSPYGLYQISDRLLKLRREKGCLDTSPYPKNVFRGCLII